MFEDLLTAFKPPPYMGEVVDAPQAMLGSAEARVLKNITLNGRGVPYVRGGSAKINGTALNGGAAIKSGYRYYDEDGVGHTLVQAGKIVYELDHASGAATPIIGLEASRPLKWGAPFNVFGATAGQCLFSNGKLYKYDGTDAVAVSATNVPEVWRWAENLDKVWAVPWDWRNRVYRSAQLSIDDAWGSDEFSPIRSIKGGRIKDLCSVRGDWLMVLTGTSVHRIDGSTAWDIAKGQVTGDLGLLGNTLAPHEGAAIWLSGQGVVFLPPADDSGPVNISENKVNSDIFLNHTTTLDQTVGCYYPKKKVYLLSVPGHANGATVWAFHFGVNVGQDSPVIPVSRWEMPFKVVSMWTADGPDDNGQLFFGDDQGYAYFADYGYLDDGAGIAAEYEPGYESLAGETGRPLPDFVKEILYLYVAMQATGSITLTLKGDYGQVEKVLATDSFVDPDTLIWGTGQWDVHKWAHEYAPSQRIFVDMFNAKMVTLNFSGTFTDKTVFHPPVIKYRQRDVRYWK